MEIVETRILEVATGGQPEKALDEAVMGLVDGPYLLSVGVAHDDECPCAGGTRPMAACTCELVRLEVRRLA